MSNAATGAGTGALTGGLAGAGIGTAIMPGVGTAIGAAGGAVIGGLAGYLSGNASDNAADAAQGAASAQLAQAQQNRVLTTAAANPTVSELEQMHSNYQAQDRNLSRQEALLSTYDPAYMEANKQLLQNLRGQASAALAPLQAQRAQQRSDLVNSINSQMGDGGASSSAGIAALNKFDMDTASTMASAQQNVIGQLMNYSASGVPNVNQTIQQGNNNIGQEQNQQGMYISAVNNQPITPYSGAPFAGQAAQAAGQQNIANNASQMIGTIGGAAMTGALARQPAATGESTIGTFTNNVPAGATDLYNPTGTASIA